MARTTKANELTIGDVFAISGKLVFSHITKRYEPGTPEFEQKNIRRMSMGSNMKPFTQAHTSITIRDPKVKTKNPHAFIKDGDEIKLDKTLMSKLEIYATEYIYKHSSGQWRVSVDNPGNLPEVYELNKATKQAKLIKPEAELATDLDVTLLFRVYKGKYNIGVTLQSVIVNEPIRYYSGNTAQNMLEKLGFTVIRDEQETESEVESNATGSLNSQSPTQPEPQSVVPEQNVPETSQETSDLTPTDGEDDVPW